MIDILRIAIYVRSFMVEGLFSNVFHVLFDIGHLRVITFHDLVEPESYVLVESHLLLVAIHFLVFDVSKDPLLGILIVSYCVLQPWQKLFDLINLNRRLITVGE